MQEKITNFMPKNTLKQVAQKAAEPKDQKDKKEKKNRQSKTDNDDLKEPNVGRLEKVAQVVGFFLYWLRSFPGYLHLLPVQLVQWRNR
ncbi:MAG: hypothetical protein IPH88_01980 [Bacteroidales bacterium]|nr:hypothetical protein [Bacteroidales bacterium]